MTDKEIDFAVLGTGPANPLGYCLLECYKAGVQAYFDYRNSLGGVNGRQLVERRPATEEDLLDIWGIGEQKRRLFGTELLRVIAEQSSRND